MILDFGKLLQEELNKEGAPSMQDFASMLAISYRTLYNVFNDKSQFTLQQTIRASEILKVDLIGKYLKSNGKFPDRFEDEESIYNSDKPQDITISLTVKAALTSMGKFPELLEVLQKEARSRGFLLI